MRDNPYDFEETVSEYAFPVTENGNKAVTASNLIKAFLFMDKILRYFRCTKIPLSRKSRQILYYLFLILLSTKKAGYRYTRPTLSRNFRFYSFLTNNTTFSTW